MSDTIKSAVTLNSHFLGALSIELDRRIEIGPTPAGARNFAVIAGGTLKGPAINAKILPGGSDSLVRGSDGSGRPDCRLILETDDGAIILVRYQGIRFVEGDQDYWRCLPLFETASDKYGWMNRIICVSLGRMDDGVIVYDIFQID
ncbi:DUF3237 domain-containing protein [Paraburkholderia sp. LEh10]|uniref:DUF3237 domain-containing protein n=1 Tax=Paraburkholderia sp. LEh10 TaxID=2821353 RepID=UPI001AE7358C|nr:DUF3237 domain-containing protein [Paraburkholderia sp. LEh10]MBP0590425.1 DUF3237 domain-containing protein [Paraburkholderia sp. LEh10]